MASTPVQPLIAHSLEEVHLYLRATPCPECNAGFLRAVSTASDYTAGEGGVTHVVASCHACSHELALSFQVPVPEQDELLLTTINPGDQPSNILDVGQWFVLFGMITEAASHQSDQVEARCLRMEAAQCLEEAMKFYDDESNDLPSANSFWTEASRKRFRDAPSRFSRDRLLHLRAKLPTLNAVRQSIHERSRRPWWRQST